MTKISKSGYKRNSKDKKEKSLIIPSSNITMKNVDFPVFGVDNLGNTQMMYPGMDYNFPGEYVYEVPMARYGGDPSIPDLSEGWLSKYQTAGQVEGPKVIQSGNGFEYGYSGDNVMMRPIGQKEWTTIPADKVAAVKNLMPGLDFDVNKLTPDFQAWKKQAYAELEQKNQEEIKAKRAETIQRNKFKTNPGSEKVLPPPVPITNRYEGMVSSEEQLPAPVSITNRYPGMVTPEEVLPSPVPITNRYPGMVTPPSSGPLKEKPYLGPDPIKAPSGFTFEDPAKKKLVKGNTKDRVITYNQEYKDFVYSKGDGTYDPSNQIPFLGPESDEDNFLSTLGDYAQYWYEKEFGVSSAAESELETFEEQPVNVNNESDLVNTPTSSPYKWKSGKAQILAKDSDVDYGNPHVKFWAFKRTAFNDEGMVYIPTPRKENWKGKGIDKTAGMAHFLIKSDLTDGHKDPETINSIKKSIANNQYLPIYKKEQDGKVRLKYIKGSESLEEGWDYVAALRQEPLSNINWSSSARPYHDGPSAKRDNYKRTGKGMFGEGISNVLTKDGKDTWLVYKDANGRGGKLGRFNGNSLVFIIEKNGERIIRDFTGTVEAIEKESINLLDEFGVTENDVTLAFYDQGSYTAKPKADKNGFIPYKNYNGFNKDDTSGAGLAIPFEDLESMDNFKMGGWLHKYQPGGAAEQTDLRQIDIANPDSSTLTYVSPNIEIAKKQAPAVQKELQRRKVEETKQGNRDQWGRPYNDPWYGFDPSTKQFTVRDAWGRTPQSDWYGFDPSAKAWSKGSASDEAREYAKYDESLKYTNDYLKSPMYKEMLQQSVDSPSDFDYFADSRAWNLANTPPLQILPQPEQMPSTGGVSYNNTGQIILYPKGFGSEDVLAHELSHSTDRPANRYTTDRLIPKKDINYILNNKAKSFKESREYLEDKEFYDTYATPEALLNIDEDFNSFYRDYVGDPSEVRARLNAIRKIAKDNNIYDPFIEKVSPEVYYRFLKNFKFGKSRKSGPMRDLQEIFTDDEIIHMLNSISENKPSKTDNLSYGKYGGWLQKYQTTGEVNSELSKYMKQPMDPNDLRYVGSQQAVQDNTRVVVPKIQTAKKDAPAAVAEIQRVNAEMKNRGVKTPKEVYAQEKTEEKTEAQQAAAIEAATNDKLYADNQSAFDKAMYKAYNVVSNPMEAFGHYANYGYIPQGNLGNYGLKDQASPMATAVNMANPFAWLNAGIRLGNDLEEPETYTTWSGAGNALMDALEMLPMFTETRPLVLSGAAMLADDAARAGKYFAPKSFNKIIWPEKPSSIKGFIPTKNVEFTNTAKTIANKVDLPKGVSKEDLMSIIDKNLNWVKSDEYIARRMATTGETKDQVVKLTEKWIDDLTNNTSYNSEAAIKSSGLYSYLKNFPFKGKSYVNVSDDVFQNQPDAFLDVWEHEFLHGLSPALKQPKLYNDYPSLNVTPKRSFVQKLKDQVSGEQKDLNYFNLPSEQQVRAVRLNSKIRKDLGIADNQQLTKEHLDKWFDEYYNTNLESLGESGFNDVTELLDRAGNLYENTTGTSARPMFLDWLNKAWGVTPAAIGTGAATVIAGQDTPQQKYGGWLNKYQGGGAKEELSKFIKQPVDTNDLRYVNIAPEVQESTRVNIPNIKNAPKTAKAVKEEAARVKQKMQQEGLSTSQEVYALENKEAKEAQVIQNQLSTLSPAKDKGLSDYANYAWDIASSPMTAARYKMMGQDIPWNFKMSGERNILDMPLDMVNPAFYMNLAGDLASASIDPDTYTDAGKTLWAGAKGLAGDRVSPEEMQAVGNTAGLLLDAGMFIPAGRLASKFVASPYVSKAVANTPLRYTYKINPTAKGSVFTPLEANMNYRYVNEAGYEDALKTFLVKANSIGDNSALRRPTGFPSFSKGKPAKAFKNTDSTPHYLMQSDVPMYARGEINPVTGKKIVGRHGAARPIDPNTGEVMSTLTLEDINNIYKAEPNWFKGYETVYRSPKNADVSKIILGQNIANTGSYNEGVYELPDYPGYLLKYERPKAVSYQIPEFMEMDLAQMQKNIKTPNIGKVIKQERVLSDKKTKYLPNKKSSVNTKEALANTLRDSQNPLREVSEYVDPELDMLNAYIMRRIQGQPVLTLPLDELSKIPSSAWKNYFADVKEFAKNDLAIDSQGVNVYYNHDDKAFKFIDLSPGVTPGMSDYWENIVIRGMSKNLSEDVMNRKITEGMMGQYDRALYYQAEQIDKTLPQSWTADQRSKFINDILLDANLKRGVLERSLKRPGYKDGGSFKYQGGGSSDYDKIPQSWKDTYDWTPNVEAEYQAFKNDPMGPSNLAGTDDMNDYNTRGMWDSLDRPANWKQGLDLYKQQWGEEWTPEEDGYYHAWSQHPGTGEWLKPKHHDTAWMNYGSYIYDPNNMAVVNPEGFFGNETLQSYPKEVKYPDGGGVFNNSINKKHNLKTSAEGYYAYINGVTLSKGGSPKSWLDKYK